jgi:threonine dehydrogenase-like Zn-dependent dehydrogenase
VAWRRVEEKEWGKMVVVGCGNLTWNFSCMCVRAFRNVVVVASDPSAKPLRMAHASLHTASALSSAVMCSPESTRAARACKDASVLCPADS